MSSCAWRRKAQLERLVKFTCGYLQLGLLGSDRHFLEGSVPAVLPSTWNMGSGSVVTHHWPGLFSTGPVTTAPTTPV